MEPIPIPETLRRHDSWLAHLPNAATARTPTIEELTNALAETRDYAIRLWETLDGQRQYLMNSLPNDPRSPGPRPRTGARPTGPDDDEGWQLWISAYAAASDSLWGPGGDGGFGLKEAQQAAKARRTAPNLRLFVDHPRLEINPESSGDPVTVAAPENSSVAVPAATVRAARLLRAGVKAAVVLLALRGLRTGSAQGTPHPG